MTFISAATVHRRIVLAIVSLALCLGLGLAWPYVLVPRSHATAAAHPTHRILFHVAADDVGAMSHAISAADNAMKFYRARGESVAIEIVANGAGVRMMRADLSPVAPSIAYLHQTYPGIVLSACGTTLRLMTAREGAEPPLLPGVTVTPAGIARIIELEEEGWSYVRA